MERAKEVEGIIDITNYKELMDCINVTCNVTNVTCARLKYSVLMYQWGDLRFVFRFDSDSTEISKFSKLICINHMVQFNINPI
jgi:hypothetical protein